MSEDGTDKQAQPVRVMMMFSQWVTSQMKDKLPIRLV
jgi:hypothetical protein